MGPVIGRAALTGQKGTVKAVLAGGKRPDLGCSSVRRSVVVGLAWSGGVSGGSGGWSLDAFEAAESDQVVGGGDEVARETGAVQPSVAGATEATDGLDPAEDLLDSLADALADSVGAVKE